MRYCRIICIFLILLIVLMFIGCTYVKSENNKDMVTDDSNSNDTMLYGLAYIDGKVVKNLPIFVSSANVGIPFLQTVQALGMRIEKKDEVIYVINNDDIYILHYSPNISFTKQGEMFNLLLPPPGCSSPYLQYKPELNDVFLDAETIDGVLYLMGIDIDTSIDSTKNTVTIIRKKTKNTGDGSVS